ncbi:SGNH/GDSL hydrolase family protein [Streptomyces sp. NPDC048565]|uniref:SGNH/GDSL hydrolase family protein n=1 Tax=Streptomyces sp. NPDC048565 TaxID=3155266 RepID=UPI00342EEC22
MSPASQPSPRAGRSGRTRRAVRVPLAAAAVMAALAASAGAAHAGPRERPDARGDEAVRYVALGDSFSSGPGVPDPADGACGRSARNYPSLLAAELGAASYADVTCAGADTGHMTQPQGAAPPQLDALRPDTTLVTLGVGGNDLDLTGILTRCAVLGGLVPDGAPCKDSFTLLGTDEVGSRIASTGPRIAAVLAEIHGRSPRARVLVVGYPAILPDDGTACRPTVPLATGDFPWIRDKEKQLNSMLARQAGERGDVYVDAYAPSVGHDACKPEGVRWIEPEDTAQAAGFHPNAAGHRNTADAALATLTR